MEIIKSIGEFAAVILSVSGVVMLLGRPIQKQILKKIDEQKRLDAEQNQKITEVLERLGPLSAGVQHLLRFRIVRECKRITEAHQISEDEYKGLYRLHEAYKNLGQNGLISALYDEAMKQPRNKEDKNK